MTDQLRAEAENFIRGYIQNGWNLEMFLDSHQVSVCPGDPTVWIYRFNTMYKDRAGDERVKLKRHEMGVVLHFKDGHSESAIFDYRQLWRDIVDPQPKQLSFLDLIS